MIVILYSYIIGCFCFAYYTVKYKTGKDIRKLYSGTVGAKNVNRILGFKYAFLVFLLDILKALLAIYITHIYFDLEYFYILSVTSIILGHIFPIQLKFKGGKGISVFIGSLLGIIILVNTYNHIIISGILINLLIVIIAHLKGRKWKK